jgi:hypothetical protein
MTSTSSEITLREFNDFIVDYGRNPAMEHLQFGQAFYNAFLKSVVGNETAEKLHALTDKDQAVAFAYEHFVNKPVIEEPTDGILD